MSAWNETVYTCPWPEPGAPLVLELAGITHPDPAYRISRADPGETYVLEYVIRGQGHVYCGDRYYPIAAGDVYFLQPHVPHKYCSDPADPWEKIWFNLHGPLLKALCEAYRLHGVVYYHHCPLQEDFFHALETVRNWRNDSLTELSLRIHRILGRLHAWRNSHPEWRKSPEGVRIKEYLDQNWQRKIPLAELARLIHKSQAQMMRIFRQDWNDSPGGYLQKQRDCFSRQYLENTNCPIKELAMRMGFKDEFYFSNWFKRRNGISPTGYRNRFR